MDVSRFLNLDPAPRAVFDNLATRRDLTRFMIPGEEEGSWLPITWDAFATEIEEVALYLESLGLERGDRATILAHNRVPWISSALAIQAAGGVMVPIYPSSTAEQVAYVIEHSDARVLFIDSAALLARVLEQWERNSGELLQIISLVDGLDVDAILDRMRDAGKDTPPKEEVASRFVSWSDVRARGAELVASSPGKIEQLLDAITLDDGAVMLYTSGTTGLPKGVPLTHRNVASNGRDWLECNGPLLKEGYIDLLWLPLSHIFGFGEVCLGNTLGFVTYWTDPASVLARLPEVAPQVFMSVPRMFEKLATAAMAEDGEDAQRAKLDALTGGKFRFCLSGGAGLKPEIKEFLHAHGVLIIEGYGLTESSPTLTLNRPDDFRFDSVGKPLPSVELKLAEDGEILAKGPNVFLGYHKNPEATAETFTEDGWLKTGDIGRWTEDGFLQIIDRKKEIIVTAQGKNVPPANIEVRFRDDPYIAHVVAYGDARPYLTAGVWLDPEAIAKHLAELGELDDAARDEALHALVTERVSLANESLARFETIKKFVIIDEPLTVEADLLTPTLKVKRKKVYETFRDAFESLYA